MTKYIKAQHTETVLNAEPNVPGTVTLYVSEADNFHWLDAAAARELGQQLIVAAAATEANQERVRLEEVHEAEAK